MTGSEMRVLSAKELIQVLISCMFSINFSFKAFSLTLDLYWHGILFVMAWPGGPVIGIMLLEEEN